MKNNSFDFIFIHGWGFDKLIWQNITNLIIKENFCSSVFCIDLNFFSKGKGEIFKSRTTKKTIVITHSYGLHWFLKNKIECPIKNNPILGNIKLSVLFLHLCSDVISMYANIEPANNSHILV